MNAHPAQASGSDPLAMLDFGSLVAGAANLRPDRIALCGDDRSGNLTFAELERRSGQTASAWGDLGLMPGERIVIVATGSAASLVAMLGALRAGLDVAVAPPQIEAAELAQFAAATGAVALASEAAFGALELSELLFAAAASSERVRLLTALGRQSIDGAAPLGTLADAAPHHQGKAGESARHALVITRDIGGRCHFHRQQTIVAAGLDFVTRAQIGTQLPLLTTIAPASFAGLAAGPAASLIAGSPLLVHAPFDAAVFAALIHDLQPVHLVIPSLLIEEFTASGLLDKHSVASLTMLTRFRQMPMELPPDKHAQLLGGALPVIDLYGIGEIAAVAEPRTAQGERIAPLAAQHMLNLDGRDVVAARKKLHYLAANGRLDATVAIEGVAVSQDFGGEHGTAGGERRQ